MPPPIAERFLEILADELATKGLAFDDDGFVSLEFGDRFVFSLVCPADSPVLYLNSDIAVVPKTGREAFIEGAMKLNHLLLESRGGALGLDEEGHRISYTYAIVMARTEEDEFLTVLDRFLESSIELQSRLRQAADGLQGGVETAAAPVLLG